MRATQSPFGLRGVVEGFYGVYYTVPQRIDLLAFLGAHDFNWYLYAPKNDRQHRSRWRDPYPREALEDFAFTVDAARAAGVTFCYALSPGVSICYSDPADFALLCAKLRSLYDLGVRDFSLLLDDIAPRFLHQADETAYASYAAAQADLCRRTLDWLRGLNPACSLSMCPTDYHGRPPFSAYLHELGRWLHPEIDVFYTGPEVCSPTISTAETLAFGAAVGRGPLIWDNYPVNDLDMQPELHLGPVRGRAGNLAQAVKGILINPMLQPEASKISLLTYAEYLSNPARYDPEAAWERAIQQVAGPRSASALRYVAENSLRSCLGTPEAERLSRLVEAALAEQSGGAAPGQATAALSEYLAALDEAVYHLRNRLRNLALRADLLPWLEQLENWYHVGRAALDLLAASEAGQPPDRARAALQERLARTRSHPKRITGDALAPLADLALSLTQPEAA